MNNRRQRRFTTPISPASIAQLAGYAQQRGLPAEPEDLAAYQQSVSELLRHIDCLDEIAGPPESPSRAASWRYANRTEDPLSAIVTFCDVEQAEDGPLRGKRIGIKDNIAVAGVPLTNGGARVPTVIPTEDAVVVERLLGAGGQITAKTNMADMAIGLGDTSAFGVCRNPHDSRFLAGGSSSGSAAAVAAGIVDMAMGTDGSGSIRIPAAWCGIVGMKATCGLVPSYGTGSVDHTTDYVGPMTSTVADNALMLEVVAGSDWRDPRPVHGEPVPTAGYRDVAALGAAGLRIGIVTEALGQSGCATDVLKTFGEAQELFSRLGAQVVPVSVPLWTHTAAISAAIFAFSLAAMVDSFGQGYGHLGRIDTHLMEAAATQYRLSGREFPVVWRSVLLAVDHLKQTRDGLHFGRAQNLRLELRRQVDSALSELDLLITPTTPIGPVPVAEPLPAATELATRNTRAFNLTGHPAVTVPSGTNDAGLPVGVQIAGRWFDERTVYQAAFAYEQAMN